MQFNFKKLIKQNKKQNKKQKNKTTTKKQNKTKQNNKKTKQNITVANFSHFIAILFMEYMEANEQMNT